MLLIFIQIYTKCNKPGLLGLGMHLIYKRSITAAIIDIIELNKWSLVKANKHLTKEALVGAINFYKLVK